MPLLYHEEGGFMDMDITGISVVNVFSLVSGVDIFGDRATNIQVTGQWIFPLQYLSLNGPEQHLPTFTGYSYHRLCAWSHPAT